MANTWWICSLTLLLIIFNHVQSDIDLYKGQQIHVCPNQQTVNTILFSFEVSSHTECIVECSNEDRCLSANICRSDDRSVCTLSSLYPWTRCVGNIANNSCTYLFQEQPCQNGGTPTTNGYCLCFSQYTGIFCEKFVYYGY